jgi:hypothetical protein
MEQKKGTQMRGIAIFTDLEESHIFRRESGSVVNYRDMDVSLRWLVLIVTKRDTRFYILKALDKRITAEILGFNLFTKYLFHCDIHKEL